MNHKTLFNLLLALGLILALGASSSLAQEATVQGELGLQAAVGTSFTYQGRLTQGGAPVAGPCDFQFSLWDAASGGAQVGSTLTKTGVALTNGYFDAVLDFGDGGLGTATFAGDARWLAIGVRCPAGSGSYTPLSGRVALNAAPYALSLRPGAVVAGDKSGFTVLTARNTTTGEFGAGLKAETNATQGTALIVESKSTSLQQTYGVYATATSRGGTAVYGESKYASSSQDNTAYGGYFKANAFGDVGVYGESAWGQGGGVGVWGKTAAQYGSGVHGEATAATGQNYGVSGSAASSGGYGVYGYSASGHGVHGKANPPDGYGVYSEGNAYVDGNLSWKGKTGYVAVSAAAFQPVRSSYNYTNWGNNLTPTDSASPYYYAAVQLPHHATITRLTFAWRDVSANNAECKLFRNNLAGGGDEMARAASSGALGSGNSQDVSIDFAYVDNALYAYYLQWQLPDPSTSGYGVIIEYTFYEPY
ncbi:MAG: hypothetical protein QHJ81_10040 [Anaerolineae bacterium]|nr:hypothetical protein [Anaerolineae bacterium]